MVTGTYLIYSEFSMMLNVFQILDLSHNNITDISSDYFTSLEYSLTHLHLSHNKLRNVSRDVFGSLYQLQWLDFSNNRIQLVDYDIFKEINNLQVTIREAML